MRAGTRVYLCSGTLISMQMGHNDATENNTLTYLELGQCRMLSQKSFVFVFGWVKLQIRSAA